MSKESGPSPRLVELVGYINAGDTPAEALEQAGYGAGTIKGLAPVIVDALKAGGLLSETPQEKRLAAKANAASDAGAKAAADAAAAAAAKKEARP